MKKRLNALRDTLTTWALRLMGWALIAVIILAIGFAVFIIPPPSLYFLVVFGVLMLVGILGHLMRLTSKR